jgi:hypothetical protein
MAAMTNEIRNWRAAWVGLAAALALHVTDEALTGFLPVYNRIVEGIRADYSWVPLPTFTFPVWLAGLVLGIVLLFAFTPAVSRGARWIWVVSLILSIVMIANALGHLAASLYWGRVAPGAYSSPVLLLAAILLLITATRAKPHGAHHGA